MKHSCWWLLPVLLSACGGDDSTSPPPPASDVPLTVEEALTIDLANPPSYSTVAWPVHYDNTVLNLTNVPIDNPVTDAGALLGRVLFYDPRLSTSRRVSCASCHAQQDGFTDGDRFSEGVIPGERTAFHSMRLLNARFFASGQMFWNRRASTAEAQALEPVTTGAELGFDSAHGGLDAVTARLQGQPYYRALFRRAFGDSTMTAVRMEQAIAQFVRALVSVDSRFDQGFAGVYNIGIPDRGVTQPFRNFTEEENRGKQLFLSAPASRGAGCGTCHAVPTFALVGNSFSNGLDAGEDRFFKAPSLKSVAVTGPYMHDGRFSTLARVVDFYNAEIQDGPALDIRLRAPDGKPVRLNLSAADKRALVAFLRTLTDKTVAVDARFSDPFRRTRSP